jgi:hypothetical protein
MYFMLECYGPEEEDMTAIGSWPHFEGVNWNLGRYVDKKIPTPIVVELDHQFPGLMMPMFDSGVLLFSDEMISALHKAGVDNFQCFDALVKDTVNNLVYDNYKVINILGVVAVANLANSNYESHGNDEALIDTDFDSLVIDEKKARGLLMFRLAESVNGIVIHEDVKKVLEQNGIKHLDFVLPEEWIG